jgi:hypothetical protein
VETGITPTHVGWQRTQRVLVDASQGEWPRIESSLLSCIFFYIVKIIEKSVFYEPEIGLIGKITY